MTAKAVIGIPGWCVVFDIGCGLYAMVNLNPDNPIQISCFAETFSKHGYFILAKKLNPEDIQKAEINLRNVDWKNAQQLVDE